MTTPDTKRRRVEALDIHAPNADVVAPKDSILKKGLPAKVVDLRGPGPGKDRDYSPGTHHFVEGSGIEKWCVLKTGRVLDLSIKKEKDAFEKGVLLDPKHYAYEKGSEYTWIMVSPKLRNALTVPRLKGGEGQGQGAFKQMRVIAGYSDQHGIKFKCMHPQVELEYVRALYPADIKNADGEIINRNDLVWRAQNRVSIGATKINNQDSADVCIMSDHLYWSPEGIQKRQQAYQKKTGSKLKFVYQDDHGFDALLQKLGEPPAAAI